jgi:sugar/nucleoside kinase (ribokinase family)
MKTFDVLGLGCAAADDLFYVPHYPAEDTKMQVRRHERQCGGLCATALVAASRLGARCAYAGSLGDDDLSRFVRQRLADEGVELKHLRVLPDARPVHAVILVDETRHTRTIVYEVSDTGNASPDWPPDDVLRAAKVVLVDYYGVEGMVRAARVARAAGIPIVADLERAPPNDFLTELVELVDHLVVPLDFAEAWTGRSDPADAALALWSGRREAVVVTCGIDGSWYLGRDESGVPRHQPAFRVNTVDTTGCGDVFHGAYAASLAEGLGLPQRARLASATAAMKATRAGGQPGIPTRAAVEAFLRQRSA